MTNSKPFASLSLDLDNKWSYLKTHGDARWESFPSYLDIVVPRVLSFLKERNLKITFFIVGQDAARPENHSALKMLSEAGHEIGNHSFRHEPWLHLYTEQEIASDLALAEEHIEAITGQRPVGFRGPGFSLSQSTLRVLAERGYVYDCSTFPTYLGPLARAYYFMTSKLSEEEKQQRKKLFGTFSEGFRPIKAYKWQVGNRNLFEIPVTTMPFLKVPVHFSYLLYLSKFSTTLALHYFRLAILMCQISGVQPSLLLHPLDFLGCDDTSDLDFFPAMRIPSVQKLRVIGQAIDMLTSHYRVEPIKAYVDVALREGNLPILKPTLLGE